MLFHTNTAKVAAAATALLWSAAAHAASDPTGIWFDHDGRGAVEIKQCPSGSGLCGHVVYVVDPKNTSRCGLQILGEVTPEGGGWIYSPERKSKYDVALKRLSDEKLRVVGNANSRFFSRTFTWNRAPDNLIRCSTTTAAAPAAGAKSEPTTKSATAVAPSAAPVGAATGSAALVANTPVKTAPEPVTDNVDTQAAPPVANAQPQAQATKTAAASESAGQPAETTAETGSKRTCKYRIPYVGRTVSVRCR